MGVVGHTTSESSRDICKTADSPSTAAFYDLKKVKGQMFIQGHRGYGSDALAEVGNKAPHNSILAFEKAAKDPSVTSVEFDIRRSMDGFLVVTHGPGVFKLPNQEDNDISDLPGGQLDPSVFTWEQIQKINIQDDDASQVTRIPLFKDVIRLCVESGLKMNVELKTKDTVEETVQLLRDEGALSSVLQISSFWRSNLQKVMELEPSIPLGSLYNFVLPGETKRAPSPADFATWQGEGRLFDSVNLCAETVNEEDVRAARAANRKLMVWFPVDAEENDEVKKKLVEFDVDVVCVNDIDKWRDVAIGVQGEDQCR